MCDVRPGDRCAAESCPTAIATLERYTGAFPGPDAPAVEPLGEAKVLHGVTHAGHLAGRQHAREQAVQRIIAAELAYEASPARNSLSARVALEDAYQDLTIADLDAAFPNANVHAQTAESAHFRLQHGVNAVIRKVHAEDMFTATDAMNAPVGTLVQGPGGFSAHHWYKYAPNRWAHMKVNGEVAEFGNWTGLIRDSGDVASDDAVAYARQTLTLDVPSLVR